MTVACDSGSDDGDGSADASAPPVDGCPDDPDKLEPGRCGCGVPEGSCAACADKLGSDQQLVGGEYLCDAAGTSQFGVFYGDLYFKRDAQTIWRANARDATRVRMQGDGNLVLRDAAGTALFSTRTQGNAGATLAIESGGRGVVVRDLAGCPLWYVGDEPNGCAPLDGDPP
jgi:hypothetical protein